MFQINKIEIQGI